MNDVMAELAESVDFRSGNGTSDIVAAREQGVRTGHCRQGESALKEAVDDETVVKTAGTLIFTDIKVVFETTREKSIWGPIILVGIPMCPLRQYPTPFHADPAGMQSSGNRNWRGTSRIRSARPLSRFYFATVDGRQQESRTGVQEGTDGGASWHGESITFKCGSGRVTQQAEIVAEIWNQNPGSDVIVGVALFTARHLRALALLDGHTAPIRLPLTRKRDNGRMETQGELIARARLVHESQGPRISPSAGQSPKGSRGVPPQLGSSDGDDSSACCINSRDATLGRLPSGQFVFGGLSVHDLPQTEGLMFGGQQAPYVLLTLADCQQRSTNAVVGGNPWEWPDESLRLRVEPHHVKASMWGYGLMAEVWTDTQPRQHVPLGKGLVRVEWMNQLWNHPGVPISLRVKLSRDGRGRKGTVSMRGIFETDTIDAGSFKQQQIRGTTSVDNGKRSLNDQVEAVAISRMFAKDLRNMVALGFGSLDAQELYVVARIQDTERITLPTSISRAAARWDDSCLTIPLSRKALGRATECLQLELWNANPIQDNMVGFAEVDLLDICQNSDRSIKNSPLSGPNILGEEIDARLQAIGISGGGATDNLSPGIISCGVKIRLRSHNPEGEISAPIEGPNEAQEQRNEWLAKRICLPVIGKNEGPGCLKVTVLDGILHEVAEVPEVRIILLPGKRSASTRPLIEVGGTSASDTDASGSVRCEWKQELELPCYRALDEIGDVAILQAEVVVAGVLAGQRVLGRGQADVAEVIRSPQTRRITLEMFACGRGKHPHSVGRLSLSLAFRGAWSAVTDRNALITDEAGVGSTHMPCLHSPGVLRVFVLEAKELSGTKPHQEAFVVVEKLAVDATIPFQAKPFYSSVAVISSGKEARWLESCDLRLGSAEAAHLKEEVDGGSVRLRVTLMDKDLLGGEQAMCSLETAVTPNSLSNRESSVLWHRLYSQGRDRGFLRLGCCWIPAEQEPTVTCGLRPEERVETGTLYLWLREGCNLRRVMQNGQCAHGIPMCEIELRPYTKFGRKKAQEIEGCARVPEQCNPELDRGVFHKFIKMDFTAINPIDDNDLAETPPTFKATVFDTLDGKREVAGRAELLLASLCGYQNLNGAAILREASKNWRENATVDSGLCRREGHFTLNVRDSNVSDVCAVCPVAAVEKTIPLLDDGIRSQEASRMVGNDFGSGGSATYMAGRGGELQLQALFVPNRLADAPGVRSAIKALSRAAESSLQHFTENPRAAIFPGKRNYDEDGGDGRVLNASSTALPGALEVFLIRATDLQTANTAGDPFVQLRLLCSGGCELHTSEVVWDANRLNCEWNRQFSLLVDDANVETLEIMIVDAQDPLLHRKVLAQCGIPLRRYAQNYHSSLHMDIGQVTPTCFKLTDRRGRGYRGSLFLSLHFVPEVTQQARILREAFAPSASLEIEGPTTATIDVLVVSMDGSDVSSKDCVRVTAYLAADSDDWGRDFGAYSAQSGGSGSVAVSGIGAVDETTATCRWGRRQHDDRDGDANGISPMSLTGDYMSLRWDSKLPSVAWGRGRASVLKFEVTRGPGQPPEWTGSVPTAAFVHRPGLLLERAVKLTGRVGVDPPVSARETGSRATLRGMGVTLEVAMIYRSHHLRAEDSSTGDRKRLSGRQTQSLPGTSIENRGRDGADRVLAADTTSIARSPFHQDVRRNPPEGGELVVHCIKARNLRVAHSSQRGAREVDPSLSVTAVPDGKTALTSAHTGGGRHPVWKQTLTLSVADATIARVIVRVLNTSEYGRESIMGEVELSVAGIVAAEKAVAAAAAAAAVPFALDLNSRFVGGQPRSKIDRTQNTRERAQRKRNDGGREEDPERDGKKDRGSRDGVILAKEVVKPCGVETWFPVFLPCNRGGNRDREPAGEVRLSCRFLSTNFMLQRQLTAGADEGDNGPIGQLRYSLEKRPGRMFFTVRCLRGLQKPMIGERAPLVEARLCPGEWTCSTRREAGLDPVFNESMAVDLLWTPQDFDRPELVLEVKDKALGGGQMAVVRVPLAPFVLHPRMKAEVWYPLIRDGRGDTSAGIFCDLVYVPFPDGTQNDGRNQTKNLRGPSPVLDKSAAGPGFIHGENRCRSGIMHVEILSVRGLPASSKDPQVGVRLRVPDQKGIPLPPFQRTAAVRGGRGKVQFDQSFLLALKRSTLCGEDQTPEEMLGRTPVLEVEARCVRGKGKLLGTVDIPLFPLWFMGHMTRTWYPLSPPNGAGEAGIIFIGIQFLVDEGVGGGVIMAEATTGTSGEATQRRKFLFIEVRQGRGLRRSRGLQGQDPAIHLELLGSGASAKTPAARDGGTDPEWCNGAGVLTMPYRSRGSTACGTGAMHVSEVLRITVVNERGLMSGDAARDLWRREGEDRMIGQCDWPLPADQLADGHPLSAWYSLWTGGNAMGEIYIRCRLGFEGEALDYSPSRGVLATKDEGSAAPLLAVENYHVEVMNVRGFERIVRRKQLSAEVHGSDVPCSTSLSWEGKVFMSTAPAAAGNVDAARGASSVPVATGRALAVRTRGMSGGRYLCVSISTNAESPDESLFHDTCGASRIEAVCSVPPERLQHLREVPGSELREWFPMVATYTDRRPHGHGVPEADTGQVLISLRYAPVAVGVLEVSVLEAEMSDEVAVSAAAHGMFRALTRLLPATSGASTGQTARTTPARRALRRSRGHEQTERPKKDDVTCLWSDARSHRMRFTNAFNDRPSTLHVSVVRGDGVVGFATVPVEPIIQEVMSSIRRDLDTGIRRSRGSSHDIGPIGGRDGDFEGSNDLWYTLHMSKTKHLQASGDKLIPSLSEGCDSSAESEEVEVGRIRVSVRFAPHPKMFWPNWQDSAAVERAKRIRAMKALFYRVDRNGSLVVEKEDLRAALIEAAGTFLSELGSTREERTIAIEPARSSGVERGGGMAQAGAFVLQVIKVLQANRNPGRETAPLHTALDSVFRAMDRDRSGQVKFVEYCLFLSKAAARQAEAEISDLVNELAEDNDDDDDDDGKDDSHGEVGSDGTAAGVDSDAHGNEQEGERSVETFAGTEFPSWDEFALGSGVVATSNERKYRPLPPTANQHRRELVVIPGTPAETRSGLANAFTTSPRAVMSSCRPQQNHDPRDNNIRTDHEQEVTAEESRLCQAPMATATEVRRKSGIDMPLRESVVKNWMVDDVIRWLSAHLELPQYATTFREASVDGLVLTSLTDNLLKEMGVTNPLHRLKVLHHTRELRVQQQVRDRKRLRLGRSRPHRSPILDQKSPRSSSFGFELARVQVENSFNRNGMPTANIAGRRRGRAPQSRKESTQFASTHETSPGSSVDVDCREVFPSLNWRSEVESTRRNSNARDEGAFVHAMEQMRIEFVREGGNHKLIPAGRRQNRREKAIPAKATTSEVLKVVKGAMWAAARNLHNQRLTETVNGGVRVELEKMDEALSGAWLERSHDENAGENGANFDNFLLTPRNVKMAQTGARLLFSEFVKCRGGKSDRRQISSSWKITRPKLEVGIRFLLGIKMRWDQFDLFYNSVTSPCLDGNLTFDEFATVNGLPGSSLSPRSIRPQSGPQREGGREHMFTRAASGRRTTSEMSFHASFPSAAADELELKHPNTESDLASLRYCLLGIRNKLRHRRQTLQEIVTTFDRRGSGQVSVSKFISLVRALAAADEHLASTKGTGDDFSRRQAYFLLRCVDRTGHRKVSLKDFIQFVFDLWTGELSRLQIAHDEGGGGEDKRSGVDVTRRRRRQLQKDIQRHFPANFRRSMNLDETGCAKVNGTFTALLSRLGLADNLTPPTMCSHASFGSPRRLCHNGTLDRLSADSSHDGVPSAEHVETRLQFAGWEISEAQTVDGRTELVSPLMRRSTGKGKRLSAGDRTRPATWGGGGTVAAAGSLSNATDFQSKRQHIGSRFESPLRAGSGRSLSSRMDVDDIPVSAHYNRLLLAQGTWSTHGRGHRQQSLS